MQWRGWLSCGLWAAVIVGQASANEEQDASGAGRHAPIYEDHERLLVVKDGNGAKIAVAHPEDWDVRRAHTLAHFMEVTGELPGGERRVPLHVRETESKDEARYVRKKIWFASEPCDEVPAWLLIPKSRADGNQKRPGVLCLHQTIAIGKDEPAGLGKNQELAYARELAERGYIAIVPDYPNFGDYKVDVYKLGYASATMKGIWNHMRAVDLLTSLPEVDPEKIGVIGHSLGGHNSIFVALFDPRIKAIVSSCGFNAFPNYYGGKIAGWSHKGYMPRLRERYELNLKRVPFDFPELIGALAPRGFFANAPMRDANFEVAGVRVCFDAARPVYELLGASGRLVAAYPDDEHAFPQAVRQLAYEFLNQQLKVAR
jgi:dienelactone hydrolase